MRSKRKDIFRLLLADFSIFVLSVFVVSDLINLHLRLIYHVDILATQSSVYSKVSKSKENKVKAKVFSLSAIISEKKFLKYTFFLLTVTFFFDQSRYCYISDFDFLSRAPPANV